MRFINVIDIRSTVLCVATVLCAVTPAQADFQAAPVSVIEVITAEVPANLLAEDSSPDDAAAARPPGPSTADPKIAEKNELGSAIFNPFSQAARQRAGASGQAAASTTRAGIWRDAITLVAVLAGVAAVFLLARSQAPDSTP
jgi:hypothetical protein